MFACKRRRFDLGFDGLLARHTRTTSSSSNVGVGEFVERQESRALSGRCGGRSECFPSRGLDVIAAGWNRRRDRLNDGGGLRERKGGAVGFHRRTELPVGSCCHQGALDSVIRQCQMRVDIRHTHSQLLNLLENSALMGLQCLHTDRQSRVINQSFFFHNFSLFSNIFFQNRRTQR